MFEILAVTNRLLCAGGKDAFLRQIEKITACGVKALILREKDLALKDYTDLARDVMALCAAKNVRFIVHSYIEAALDLHCPFLHLPWSAFVLREKIGEKGSLSFGVSVHSLEEARLAIERGASWLIAGHIFQTKCKQGLDGRGLEFLAALCKISTIPVYGIGGINEDNIATIAKTGAAGACLMSSLMQSEDPSVLYHLVTIPASTLSVP